MSESEEINSLERKILKFKTKVDKQSHLYTDIVYLWILKNILDSPKFDIFLCYERKNDIPLKEFANLRKRLGEMTKSGLLKHLNFLEEYGLLTSKYVKKKNGREKIYKITESGIACMDFIAFVVYQSKKDMMLHGEVFPKKTNL